MLRHQFPLLITAGFVAACLLGCGCALTDRAGRTFSLSGKEPQGTALPPLRAPRGAIELEIIFAERPADDPLLGDTGLWREVDTIGSLGPDVRKSLLEVGFRAGHVGSTPPRALESILGLSTEATPDAGSARTGKLAGRRIVLHPDGETEIQTSPLLPECTVVVPTSDGPQEKTFSNARCVIRVRAEREQDGWARLEFLPEIHHGRHGWRPMPTDAGQWTGHTSQKIHPLYGLRFSIVLNVGEMAVITADPAQARSPGRRFFVHDSPQGLAQRVLVVRLADMGRTEAVYGR